MKAKLIDNLKEIQDRIRNIICETYCCEYIRNIGVEPLNPIGYKISLPLWADERPFSISIEATGENFFKLFTIALRESSLNSVLFSTIGLHDSFRDKINYSE